MANVAREETESRNALFPRLLSGEEALKLVGVGAFELVQGRIIKMDYTGDEHGLMESDISWHLINFNKKHKLGWVLTGEVGVYTQHNPDTVRAADIVFVSYKRLPAPTGKALAVAPELIVEITSPGDRWREMRSKLEEYFTIGVEQVWIVEPEKRSVLIFRSSTDLSKFSAPAVLKGEGFLKGFELPLSELFNEE